MRATVVIPKEIRGIDGGRFRGDGGGRGAEGGGPLMPTAQLFVWLLIVGVGMLFAALSSAAIVRIGLDGQTLRFPPIVWGNTAVLLLSSLVLGLAQWHVGRQGMFQPSSLRLFGGAVGCGLLFLLGQLGAWYELIQQGILLTSSSAAAFFYVLTAAHGVHVLGGIVALSALWINRRRGAVVRRWLGPVATYWHFLTLVWFALLAILQLR